MSILFTLLYKHWRLWGWFNAMTKISSFKRPRSTSNPYHLSCVDGYMTMGKQNSGNISTASQQIIDPVKPSTSSMMAASMKNKSHDCESNIFWPVLLLSTLERLFFVFFFTVYEQSQNISFLLLCHVVGLLRSTCK